MSIGEPEVGSRDDIESIIELAELCFPKDRDAGGMLPRWPHCFTENSIPFLIRDGRRTVSQVICVRQQVMVGTRTLRVGGISSVCTHPDYRRRGLMTKLLSYVIAYMKREGFAVSDLGGDTQRYRRFGWENAGQRYVYRITPRSMSASRPPHGFTVSRYSGTEEEVFSTLRLHQSAGWGIRRERELHRLLLNRAGKETWLSWHGQEVSSYMVVDRSQENVRVLEVAGSAEGLHSLAQFFIDGGAPSLEVALPAQHPLTPKALSISSGYHISTMRMIRVLNLAQTLQTFVDQLGTKFLSTGIKGPKKVSLAMRDNHRIEHIVIEFSAEATLVSLVHSSTRPMILLGPGEMAAFLFGPLPPSSFTRIPSQSRFFESLLPLNLYLWENEGV